MVLLSEFKKSGMTMFQTTSQAPDEKSSLVQCNSVAKMNEDVDDDDEVHHSDRGLYIIIAIAVTATAALTIAVIFQAIFGEPQVGL